MKAEMKNPTPAVQAGKMSTSTDLHSLWGNSTLYYRETCKRQKGGGRGAKKKKRG